MSERSVFTSALKESGLHHMGNHLEGIFRDKGLTAALSEMDRIRSTSAGHQKLVERSAEEYGEYGEAGKPLPEYDVRREFNNRERGYK